MIPDISFLGGPLHGHMEEMSHPAEGYSRAFEYYAEGGIKSATYEYKSGFFLYKEQLMLNIRLLGGPLDGKTERLDVKPKVGDVRCFQHILALGCRVLLKYQFDGLYFKLCDIEYAGGNHMHVYRLVGGPFDGHSFELETAKPGHVRIYKINGIEVKYRCNGMSEYEFIEETRDKSVNAHVVECILSLQEALGKCHYGGTAGDTLNMKMEDFIGKFAQNGIRFVYKP